MRRLAVLVAGVVGEDGFEGRRGTVVQPGEVAVRAEQRRRVVFVAEFLELVAAAGADVVALAVGEVGTGMARRSSRSSRSESSALPRLAASESLPPLSVCGDSARFQRIAVGGERVEVGGSSGEVRRGPAGSPPSSRP